MAKGSVDVRDTHNVYLSKFLTDHGIANLFSDSSTYEIKVDITGIIRQKRGTAQLAFVECKVNPISLKDISQLLGYSRVARPVMSLITSPQGVSDGVLSLLTTFGRSDVLEYGNGRRITVATWDPQRNQIDYATILPRGQEVWVR